MQTLRFISIYSIYPPLLVFATQPLRKKFPLIFTYLLVTAFVETMGSISILADQKSNNYLYNVYCLAEVSILCYYLMQQINNYALKGTIAGTVLSFFCINLTLYIQAPNKYTDFSFIISALIVGLYSSLYLTEEMLKLRPDQFKINFGRCLQVYYLTSGLVYCVESTVVESEIKKWLWAIGWVANIVFHGCLTILFYKKRPVLKLEQDVAKMIENY